jgi:LysR family glycine cleavage system transcriptional activator
MLKNRSVLPRLDYLLAFEAAAELESFAAAAKELNVSETAVSRKVKLLEAHYKCALFVRGHRSIRLTEQGRRLLGGISTPLHSIASLSKDMLSEKAPGAVRMSATNSVASLWLLPRLNRFHQANSNITISLMSSDSDKECLTSDYDLAILRGDGNWTGFVAQKLFGETVFPVCAPDFLQNTQIDGVGMLPDFPLIEVTNNHTEWLNWKTWLHKKGVDPDRVRHAAFVNTYPLAIQAAIDGLGVALGWGHLVDRHLQSGALTRPLGTEHVRTESGYYLLRRDGGDPHTESDVVANWLLQESAQRKRYVDSP